MASNAYIEFRDISFSYNGEQILDGFSLAVNRGDRLVIKGDSGRGKTTVVRLLLGFEEPDEGSILFEDEPLAETGYRRLRQQTAWLPQDLNLGTGSVEEVMQFPFQFESNPEKPADDLLVRALEQLGLEFSVLSKPFRDLSTGQRQRVGIALCHLLDKPLLLLDEPTSALDANSREKAIELLFSKEDRTIISTSHDPAWIEYYDRVRELG
ncbi:MAG: ATP-binding cassette domain-containing protein [Balneolaceae bacterium]|nr:ATP-binding cassette domain-containing protein [Balneolaceae bacterium]